MNQLAFDLAERCASKATRVSDFDPIGCAMFVLDRLKTRGPMSGELLTDAAVAHGFRMHDSRAMGAVIGSLSRKNLIRCVGYCERKKGHGTSGGRLWAACGGSAGVA